MTSKRSTQYMAIAALLVGAGLIFLMGWSGILRMFWRWERPEYSYAYFVPFLVLFFIWQKKNDLAQVPLRASWWGVLLTFVGVGLVAVGSLATLFVVVQYGFVIALHGVALTFLGWQGYKVVASRLALLFFVIPLPSFWDSHLSSLLQLLSSQIGVAVVRLFGISVFLDGNVIQLADMKLEVAEACSGLRYLFPMMAVSLIMAFMYRAPLWKRAVLFLSAIPITVLMNSLRIGLIAVSVEYWGREMAEGMLHDFEGWVVFMLSLGVLLVEMWLLNRIGRVRTPLRDAFYLELPGRIPEGGGIHLPPVGLPVVVLLVVCLAGAVTAVLLPERAEVIPQRATFAEFPAKMGEWTGKVQRMESIFVNALNFDDYILADYTRSTGEQVNFYVAYYESQRTGSSIHSPSTCLPGGGWQMKDFSQYTVDGITINGHPLRVNRSIIQKGESKQLVYYWFQERGRVMTNEYLVKLYLLGDALTENRTDGALVRLVMPLPPGANVQKLEQLMGEFTALIAPKLERYIPN